MRNNVKIGSISVGDGNPTVFVAEMGTFYNKDISKAFLLIDAAAQAKVDVIKTEILHNPNVVLNSDDVVVSYNHSKGSTNEKYFDLIKRKCVPLSDYEKIISRVKHHNIPFIASVYDFEGVDFLKSMNADGIKLWRNNFNNIPLIKKSASTGLQIIFDFVDTEVSQMLNAVEIALNSGSSGIIVNYHPGKNPTQAKDHDLSLIKKYKDLFGTPIGLSCHYKGDEIMYASIGMGVNLIEKGIYDNPDEQDQNVITSCALSDLEEVVTKIRNCSDAIGNGTFQKHDYNNKLLYGFVTKLEIKAGEIFDWNNVQLSFPEKGISAKNFELVIGKKANKYLSPDQPIKFSDLSFD